MHRRFWRGGMIWKLPRPFIIARFRSLYCPLTIEWRVSISWTRHWPFHCTVCFRIWFADSQLLLYCPRSSVSKCFVNYPIYLFRIFTNIKYFVVIIKHICAHINVFFLEGLPAKTGQWTNVFLMLGQRGRRRNNIGQHWFNVADWAVYVRTWTTQHLSHIDLALCLSDFII